MCWIYLSIFVNILQEVIDSGISDMVCILILCIVDNETPVSVHFVDYVSQARPYWIEGSGVQMI